MLSDTVFEKYQIDDDRIVALAAAILATHVNGRVLIACFRPQIPTKGHDLIRGLTWTEAALAFANNVSVRQALPDLAIPDRVIFGDICWQSSYELEGSLVHTLIFGGAYKNWANQEERTRRVARDFVDVLAEGRRLGLIAFRISGAWTDWFFDVAWDSTHFACNYDTGTWWVICSTDTD